MFLVFNLLTSLDFNNMSRLDNLLQLYFHVIDVEKGKQIPQPPIPCDDMLVWLFSAKDEKFHYKKKKKKEIFNIKQNRR